MQLAFHVAETGVFRAFGVKDMYLLASSSGRISKRPEASAESADWGLFALSATKMCFQSADRPGFAL